jgi:predicted XRE-type DNA-binding protein
MARMASRPRIGALVRDGMERQHLDQIQLAEALEVSRSAVNSWINDRAWPLNRIAALEDLLDI